MSEDIVYAKAKNIPISPLKVREVVRLISGKSVLEAENTLKFLPKRAALPVLKTLKSAQANAAQKGEFDKEKWIVKEARADKGPVLSRKVDIKPRLRRGIIEKKSTHITVGIEEKNAK